VYWTGKRRSARFSAENKVVHWNSTIKPTHSISADNSSVTALLIEQLQRCLKRFLRQWPLGKTLRRDGSTCHQFPSLGTDTLLLVELHRPPNPPDSNRIMGLNQFRQGFGCQWESVWVGIQGPKLGDLSTYSFG
jgi:hypothetical protein